MKGLALKRDTKGLALKRNSLLLKSSIILLAGESRWSKDLVLDTDWKVLVCQI